MTARLAGNEVNPPLQMSCGEDTGTPSAATRPTVLDGPDSKFSPDESTAANAQKQEQTEPLGLRSSMMALTRLPSRSNFLHN